jgi:hypothetical protein
MKKSKFLKKSLAMLLALMLVVAMIPLSASAALPEDLTLIYVDGNTVTLADAEVDVQEGTEFVNIKLNQSLGADWELRVLPVSSSELNYLVVDEKSKDVYFDKYMNADNEIKLQLFHKNGTAWEGKTEYTVTVNEVSLSTTTNVAYVENVKGVYSATVDEVNKVVNVVLARDDDQAGLGAQMKVKGKDNASVNGNKADATVVVDADNGDTFTVTSQSGNNKATYKVVATYLDALNSFSVTGTDGVKYDGEIADTNDDDIPDTITVNLPESAICDSYGEIITSPKLAVSYAAEGNVTSNVTVKIPSLVNTAVKGDGSVSVAFTDLGKGEINADSTVVVDRLGGAVQTYKLKVQLEKSNNTDITYAKVNSTLADVDTDAATIKAEVPNADQIGTKAATVELKTAASVQSVTIEGVTPKAAIANGVATWTFTNVKLDKSKIVDVVAEDGTKKQYTLSASTVSNTTDASISAIWIKDGNGNTYKADVTASEDDVAVKVPYMTTNVDDWTIFVTPASYTYVTYNGNNQLVNGETTLADVKGASLGKINADGSWTISVTANNKNTATIKKNYTLTISLEDAKTGNTLADLDFSATAQSSDKLIYRNIEKDVNTFDAQISTKTNSSQNVGNLNLSVPVSLTNANDLGLTYANVVTEFATNNGGVAYFVTSSNAGGYHVTDLAAITKTVADDITGTELKDGDQILVLPEKYARAYENGTNAGNGGWISTSEAAFGTLYTVDIEVGKASALSELKTFKVGDTTLTIEGNEITGTLPFSATVETEKDLSKATFVEFTLSDYARMFSNDTYNVGFFSNGDIEGDGVVNPIDADNNSTYNNDGNYKGYNNYKFVFVRNADHTVSVHYASTTAPSAEIEDIVVKAEDRLTGDNSSKTYTFNLKWAAPCEDADITSFKLGGYTGVINNDANDGRTIKVQVPYGTDVTGLVAEFTTSTGATVKMGSTTGMDFESGVTSANYTNPVKLYITSEDGDTTRMYTVTVEEGISFSDVNEGDWYYDNVMDAAENGYVNGMGDGTFAPKKATTRAEFAAMIANAMGYEADPNVESMFPDVADDFWGKAAINYCAQNGIISGYDDGTFQPNKAITRQEAAAILNNAFELAEKTGISSDKFADDSKIAGWAKDHVYAAKAAGLMKGDAGTGAFRPTDTIIRAEAASILMNANREGLIK